MVNKLAHKNMGKGSELVSRIQPKYHFPLNTKMLERELRISLGLPFKGKMGGQTAYGYIYNENTDTYEPLPEVFAYLWQARQYLFTSSLREVADWLNFKTTKAGYDVKISHMGLRNIMILRPPYEESQLPAEEREKIIESICQHNLLHGKK